MARWSMVPLLALCARVHSLAPRTSRLRAALPRSAAMDELRPPAFLDRGHSSEGHLACLRINVTGNASAVGCEDGASARLAAASSVGLQDITVRRDPQLFPKGEFVCPVHSCCCAGPREGAVARVGDARDL